MATLVIAPPQAHLPSQAIFRPASPSSTPSASPSTPSPPQTIPVPHSHGERDPHDLPDFTEARSEPVLYLPPLLSSLPPQYPHIEQQSDLPALHTETRLPNIDPASLSLHRALHHFRPRPGYSALAYQDAFNWKELELPIEEEREWYIVAFRSKRKEGSDGSREFPIDLVPSVAKT
jgi:hypothetical protein